MSSFDIGVLFARVAALQRDVAGLGANDIKFKEALAQQLPLLSRIVSDIEELKQRITTLETKAGAPSFDLGPTLASWGVQPDGPPNYKSSFAVPLAPFGQGHL